MAGHTHDGIDWAARLTAMRRADELEADAMRVVARRLVRDLRNDPTVIDVGSGAGGMSVALVEALCARGGGTLVLVDAVPELLDAATNAARTASKFETSTVKVRPVLADVAAEQPADFAPPADLVWAARVVHHLPDQQKGLQRLVDALAPGGWLALGEGGLDTKCLPWDLGIGEPGLQDRLIAARAEWFCRMRETIPGSTRLPIGWNLVLAEAGLTEISAFSYLSDHPAPAKPKVRESVAEWLEWMTQVSADLLHPADRRAISSLLDPEDDHYVAQRDDVYLLQTHTVHVGRRGPA